MQDWVVGVLAVLVGALFLFRGYLALRVVFPLWGGFVGFVLGASLTAGWTGDSFLGTTASWVVALALAVLFALLAYLYYAVSVVIGMASIGFVLGTALMGALGVEWSWVVVLVGVVVGVALAWFAIVANLPMMLLVVLTALTGAAMVVVGLLIVVGSLESTELTSASTTQALELGWGWSLLAALLVVVGIVSQVSTTERLSRSMRAAWDGPTR
jgi:hypothetical protein